MVTIILIVITCLVSILCFTGTLNANKLLFHAYSVWHRKEWYRMLTYGVIHGGWGHLFFNMLTLFFFGRVVEEYFQLADNELAEAAVMEKYLPKQLSEAEVETKIKEIIAQVGATSIKDMGKVMGTPGITNVTIR